MFLNFKYCINAVCIINMIKTFLFLLKFNFFSCISYYFLLCLLFTINIITIKKLIYIVNNILYNLLQTVKLLNFDFFFFCLNMICYNIKSYYKNSIFFSYSILLYLKVCKIMKFYFYYSDNYNEA